MSEPPLQQGANIRLWFAKSGDDVSSRRDTPETRQNTEYASPLAGSVASAAGASDGTVGT